MTAAVRRPTVASGKSRLDLQATDRTTPEPEVRMVSFIVPAHDEEILIGATLRALAAAGRALGDPFEIVVADDASSDATVAIAREHGARVVSIQRRQISAARNA